MNNKLFTLTLALLVSTGAALAQTASTPKAQYAADSASATQRYEGDKKLCNDESSSTARLQCRRDAKAEYDKAIQHFLMTLTPEDESTPRYLYALAATYARAGNSGEALRYARTAQEQAAARGQAELLASIERDFPALAKR